MKRVALIVAASVLCVFATVAQARIHYSRNSDNLKEGEADGQDGWAVGQPANI